jgi:hypothetical protein
VRQACYRLAMLFGGHHSRAGFGSHAFGAHMGSRTGGLPTAIHIIGIFVLVVLGIAVASLARLAARDWAQKQYGRSGYTNAAGTVAVIFVIVAAGWLALKIIRF